MNNQNALSTTSPRSPLIALLFSLLTPGLAQVYNGQLKKGILFFGILLVIPILFGLFNAAIHFYGFTSMFIVELLFRIYVLVDGVLVAKRHKNFQPMAYNTWYYHLGFALAAIIVLVFFDINERVGIQSNVIPSPANEPTIQIGDRAITNLNAYKKLLPDYGDIIVYNNENDKQFAFRVIGLPNDTIDLEQHIPAINGQKMKAIFRRDTAIDNFELSEFEEELPNGHKHLIYKTKLAIDTAVANMKDIIVPSNCYFLLGDNRDNASDSRYEGFVKRDRIIGRIVFSYWGQSKERINIDFRDK